MCTQTELPDVRKKGLCAAFFVRGSERICVLTRHPGGEMRALLDGWLYVFVVEQVMSVV